MVSQPLPGRPWRDASGGGVGGETLLLVDQHPVFAEALAGSVLELTRAARVELAHDLGSARAKVAALRPSLVLLDSHLGDESGLDLLPELGGQETRTGAIVLSESRRPDDVVTAFGRGAHAWVSKHGPVDDLRDAVRAVRAGHHFLAPSVVGPVMHRVSERLSRPSRPPTFLDTITPRERDVLECLVEGLGRQATAERLFLSPNTVRTHVQSLLRAADVHSTLALVAAARNALRSSDG